MFPRPNRLPLLYEFLFLLMSGASAWWCPGGNIESCRKECPAFDNKCISLCFERCGAKPVLKFPFSETDGFKVLQIADTQIESFETDECKGLTLEELAYPCNAYNTTDFIARLIAVEEPDLVVFTGDNINGSPDPEETFRLIFEPVLSSGTPFAVVHGNTDEEGCFSNSSLTRDQMMEYVSSRPNALSEKGPLLESHHSGNYVLGVEASSSTDVVFNMWMFDSGDYSKVEGVNGFDWIYSEQIQWYQEQSKLAESRAGRKVDAMSFFHIPTEEWAKVLNSRPSTVVGNNLEPPKPSEMNSGLLAEMRTRNDVRVVSVGHDHLNDYCGIWYGIQLCYGGGAGYTTYLGGSCYGNPPLYDSPPCYGEYGWSRRARVFEVFEDGRIMSWKRLGDDDLTKIDVQQLSGPPEAQVGELNG